MSVASANDAAATTVPIHSHSVLVLLPRLQKGNCYVYTLHHSKYTNMLNNSRKGEISCKGSSQVLCLLT